MAVKVKNIIPSKRLEAAQTNQHIASVKTMIDKVTVTNTTGAAVTFSCNLVPSGGAVGDGNAIIKDKAVATGETYVCPELVGHVLESGDAISMIASVADSLTIRASGREVT
ncbi:hypothetical protein [Acinetobacter variabilis]|uniref:Uncharacterized protein n=1 Tax=Acinetobacter variabilis TaxID=70346 RepID=N9P427_9GAMM|nr:hypothetical protein [Acinetobacter variabilis]ENX08880.1 hypothetical protein F897_02032 [Acinetobacter variabilis]UBI31030.1 hypothetical protein LA331_02325 [Acinetobacter variabilis]